MCIYTYIIAHQYYSLRVSSRKDKTPNVHQKGTRNGSRNPENMDLGFVSFFFLKRDPVR